MKPTESRGLGRPRSLMIAALALTSIACGSGGPSMGRVSGKVTYAGKPVPKGTITFVAADPSGRNAVGAIGPDGAYTVQTHDRGEGAQVGEYTVAISAREEEVLDYIPPKPIPPTYLAPAKFEKTATSGLKASVKSGSNPIDFDLKD